MEEVEPVRVSKKSPNLKEVKFYLTPYEIELLNIITKNLNISRSEAVRNAIRVYMCYLGMVRCITGEDRY